jgi:hypothetical protein
MLEVVRSRWGDPPRVVRESAEREGIRRRRPLWEAPGPPVPASLICLAQLTVLEP